MITLILIFIIELVFLLVGYYLGRQSNNTKIQEEYKPIFNKLGVLINPQDKERTIPTGQITPKTPQEKAFEKLPLKVKEGIEAVRETLDNDPAMQAHKRLVEQANKQI